MVIFVKGDLRTAVPVEFHNDIQKDVMSQGIKELVKKAEPDIVIYTAEAWAATVDEYKEGVTPPPRLQPNRVEIVFVQIEFKTGEKYSCQAKILREAGKEAQLETFHIISGEMGMGRFTDFFPITRTN
jgi:uracil phosphoribosyltransferase